SDPNFPPAATKIIAKLLQKLPADRYQKADEVLHDLDISDSGTARLTGHHTKSMLGPTGHQAAWVRPLIAVAALVIVGVAIFLVQRGVTTQPVVAQVTSTPALPPLRSLAVLPLNNLANSTRDDYLSVGLADALVTKLQSIP